MENASTALLIAGGILLGVITISLLVYAISSVSNLTNAQQEQEKLTQIANWNAEWEAYNKTRLYGADVLTVWNKAKQNNSDQPYQIEIIVYKEGTKQTTMENINTKEGKVAIFKCEEVHYNDKTGRIDRMKFTDIDEI